MVIVAAAGFLSVSGAFGFETASLLQRLAFWTGLLALGTIASRSMQHLLSRRPTLTARPLLRTTITSATLSGPLTVAGMAARTLLFRPASSGGGAWTYVFGAVLVVSIAISALHGLAEPSRFTHTYADEAAIAASSEPRFYERLSPKLRGAEVYAVQAQDHYLQVHTSRGSELILMRLGDAITELDGVEGAQTHRSWWAARGGIENITRTNGRVLLYLRNGLIVPVSRNYVKGLSDAGWI